jgi:carboxymethylenebutenolidase
MTMGTVTLESTGGSMGLYEAKPEGAARGAVIVIQEAFGVNDHIQDLCRRFAAEGYVSVAPHLFHRSGDPTIPYEDMQSVIPHVMALNPEDLTADLDATAKHLEDAGFTPEQIGMVGFCMGGSVTVLAAARSKFGAAVSFYGGGVAQSRFGMPPLLDLAPVLKTPLLAMFGDEDASIPVEEVEWLREALGKSSVPTQVIRYPEANHGFHCDARDSYHEPSATQAWKETLSWLDSHLTAK